MGVYTDIQAALDTKLAALAGVPDIAWENVSYTPTSGTSFIRPTNIPTDANRVVLATRIQRISGIYQIDIFTEAEKGAGACNTLVDSIFDHFNGVETLTSGTTVIAISNLARTTIGDMSDWFMCSITINYFVYN